MVAGGCAGRACGGGGGGVAGGQADVGELGKEASRRWGRSPWSPEGARGVAAAAARQGRPGDGDHGAVAKGEAGETATDGLLSSTGTGSSP